MYSIQVTIVAMQLMLSAPLYPAQAITLVERSLTLNGLFGIVSQTGPPTCSAAVRKTGGHYA